MSWSFGEIRALAVKAARGSGMSWGMAEEAGFACHWLEQHSLPGTNMLARLLLNCDEQDSGNTLLTQVTADDLGQTSYQSMPPNPAMPAEFASKLLDVIGNKTISPLLLGTLISDGLLNHSESGHELAFPVAQAGLLLPFFYLKHSSSMATGSQQQQQQLLLTLQEPGVDNPAQQTETTGAVAAANVRLIAMFESNVTRIITDEPGGAKPVASDTPIAPTQSCKRQQVIDLLTSEPVICRWRSVAMGTDTLTSSEENNRAVLITREERRVPESAADAITKLQAFAARTYAPMTDESRDKGAGAGTNDND